MVSAQEKIDPPLSPASREILRSFDALAEETPAPDHPYLLVAPEESGAFRDRMRRPPMDRLYEDFLQKAYAPFRDDPPVSAERMSADRGEMRKVGRSILSLYAVELGTAFADLVRPGSVDPENALAWLRVAPEWTVWSGRPHRREEGLLYDDAALETSQAIQALAIGYDAFADRLSGEERARIRRRIRKLCDWLRLVSLEEEIGWSVDEAGNWCAVLHAGLGMGGLALWDEEPNARRWVRRALVKTLRHLDRQPADGAYAEGVGYWHYGMGNVLHFFWSLRNALGIDGLRHPALERARRFPLNCLGPDACALVRFSDSNALEYDSATNGAVARLLANVFRDGALQWMIRKTSREGFLPKRHTWVYDILWYDPDLEPEMPETVSVFHPEVGWALCRGGWDRESVLLAVKSTPRWYGHAHLDANSFTILGYGGTLAADSGHTRYHFPEQGGFYVRTFAHNTIMVGDEEQRSGDVYAKDPEEFGRIVTFESNPEYDQVEAEAAGAYASGRVRSFRRRMILVKPDLVLLDDSIELTEPDVITWFFHPSRDVRVADDGSFALIGEEARLDFERIEGPDWEIEVRQGFRWTGPWAEQEANLPRPYLACTTTEPATRFRLTAVLRPAWTGEDAFEPVSREGDVFRARSRRVAAECRIGPGGIEILSAD